MKRIIVGVFFVVVSLLAIPAQAQEPYQPTPVDVLADHVNILTTRIQVLELRVAELSGMHIGKDRAVAGDYDGDGTSDAAVFRPGTGVWHIEYSGGGTFAFQWGNANDTVAPADYDGDGRTDIAVHRPSNGVLYIRFATGATTGIVVGGVAP
jgi:hypothetical protein